MRAHIRDDSVHSHSTLNFKGTVSRDNLSICFNRRRPKVSMNCHHLVLSFWNFAVKKQRNTFFSNMDWTQVSTGCQPQLNDLLSSNCISYLYCTSWPQIKVSRFLCEIQERANRRSVWFPLRIDRMWSHMLYEAQFTERYVVAVRTTCLKILLSACKTKSAVQPLLWTGFTARLAIE